DGHFALEAVGRVGGSEYHGASNGAFAEEQSLGTFEDFYLCGIKEPLLGPATAIVEHAVNDQTYRLVETGVGRVGADATDRNRGADAAVSDNHATTGQAGHVLYAGDVVLIQGLSAQCGN